MTFMVAACQFDNTSLDVNSLFTPTWSYEDSSEVSFNENFVEIKNGAVQLKALQLKDDTNNWLENLSMHLNKVNDQIMLGHNAFSSHLDLRNILGQQQEHLVCYYQFENNWEDISGNNNTGNVNLGTPSFVTIPKIGEYSASMGPSGGVTLGPPTMLNTNATSSFTIMSWFSPDTIDLVYRRIFDASADMGSGRQGSTCWVRDFSGVFRLRCELFADGSAVHLTSDSIPLSQYTHMALVGDNSSFTLYINGTETATASYTSKNPHSSYILGSDLVGTSSFLGQIDDFAMLNTSLSSEKISEIYQIQSLNYKQLSESWAPKWSSLKGYWKLDGDWQDASGQGSHGSISGVPFSTDAKVGSMALNFTGPAPGKILTPYTDLSVTERTVAFWFKIPSFPVATKRYYPIVSGTVQGRHWPLSILEDGTIFTNTYWSSSCDIWRNTGYQVLLNNWYHVTSVIDRQGDFETYINGELIDRVDISSCAGSQNFEALTLQFSRVPSNGVDFIGTLDDLATWSVGLTPSEVSQLYHRQKQEYANHYNSRVIDLGRESSEPLNLSWLTDIPFGKGLVGDFSKTGTPLPDSNAVYPLVSPNLNNGLVGLWGFDGNNNDNSGQNVQVSATGTPVASYTEGVMGLARDTRLSGETLTVLAADAPDLDDAVSLSFWIKATSDAIFPSVIRKIQFHDSGWSVQKNGTFNTLGVRIDTNHTGLAQTACNSDPLCNQFFWAPTDVLTGEWVHFAFTAAKNNSDPSNSPLNIYINGNLDFSTTYNHATGLSSPSADLILTNSIVKGSYDEIALWQRELSSEEIKQLYRRGANRIKFQVKSCVDSQCHCKSLSAVPQGTSADCDGDGLLNDQDSKDIHKAQFIGPGGDGTTFYSENFNRNPLDYIFTCNQNTSDDDNQICVNDEITFSSGYGPLGPVIDYSKFPLVARPLRNRYFQYRAYFEAEKNLACNGRPCFPYLKSVSLDSNYEKKYFGQPQEVMTTQPLSYQTLKSASIDADDCVSYQLSSNGVDFKYYNAGSWVAVASENDRSPQSDVEQYIQEFGQQEGPGFLYIKSFLESNTDQTQSCRLEAIDIQSN